MGREKWRLCRTRVTKLRLCLYVVERKIAIVRFGCRIGYLRVWKHERLTLIFVKYFKEIDGGGGGIFK